MITKDHILNTFKSRKAELNAFGINKIGLFGSYTRGEESEDSDIDILIEFEPGQESFDNFMAASDNLNKNDFLENETLKRAVVRSLEIKGEATKKIPADFKIKYPAIQWKNMSGMRDRLIHDYLGVDYSIAWDVIRNKISKLLGQIHAATDDASK